jgi:hypothetical protein
MTKTELKAKIDLFSRELRTLQAIQTSCAQCEFGDRAGWCSKHQASPPPDVRPVGCDDWRHDCVPFN